MKSIIILLSIGAFGILSSQESKTVAKIIYQETVTTSLSVSEDEYILLFDENSSFYEEVDSEEVAEKQIESETDTGIPMITFVAGRKKGLNSFFYNRSNTDFYYQSIYRGEHVLLTKEEGNKINWKIQKEFKDISGFKCQKAMGFFRGRNYTAWFTSDISVPFGPWKLHGLPGLILEAYDDDQMIYVVAKHIFSDSDIKLSDKVKEIDFSKAMSMEERFRKEEKLEQEFFDMIISKLPKGSKPVKTDKKCENCPKPLEIFD